MRGTTSGLRTDTAARLAALERQRPEWQTWLRLFAVAQRAMDGRGWWTTLAGAESAGANQGAPAHAPLLHGRTLEVDPGDVRRLVRRLLSAAADGDTAGAASLRGYRPTAADAVVLLRAAVRQDPAAIGALALAGGVDPGALIATAEMASLPLLQACGRLLGGGVPAFWPHGYCPICAGWPILSERRGLDRTRRLRCGRCGGDWESQCLSCSYCGERDHALLGSLVPDDRGDRLKVETCESCRGYLKSVATLQGMPPSELLLQDLETVELDLVALDRGYRRPNEPGFRLDARVVAGA